MKKIFEDYVLFRVVTVNAAHDMFYNNYFVVHFNIYKNCFIFVVCSIINIHRKCFFPINNNVKKYF